MTPLFIQIIIGVTIAAAVALIAGRTRLLKPSGAWGALVLGSVVFGIGGVAWSAPLLTFFFLSSLLSKFGSRRVRGYRERLQQVFEKGSTRDAGQVIANGGVAGAIVLFYLVAPMPELYIAYLGALAAAAADTWGTEIGVMSRGPVVSVRTLRRVEPGTSGGVSLWGTAGAVCGALSVALSGIAWLDDPSTVVAVVVVSGLFGMLADSLAGATLQASYRCRVCDSPTERKEHCEQTTRHISGLQWVNNDVVNLVCTLVGSVMAVIAFVLFR